MRNPAAPFAIICCLNFIVSCALLDGGLVCLTGFGLAVAGLTCLLMEEA